MICAWDKLLRILPMWMREDVDRLGKESLLELRLRLHQEPMLCLRSEVIRLSKAVRNDDLNHIINTASNYSPWSATSVGQGYLTTEGGHRIGICGDTVIKNGAVSGFRQISALCIRIARDFPGIAKGLDLDSESVLVIGPPGSGKTTLLRDLIRHISSKNLGSVSVVDERGELFPGDYFSTGDNTDVITGCKKSDGIELLLRTMGPEWIAVDEITAQEDCKALIYAGWCGVKLLASAHAANLQDLQQRPVYRPLIETGLFQRFIVMKKNKTFRLERMHI